MMYKHRFKIFHVNFKIKIIFSSIVIFGKQFKCASSKKNFIDLANFEKGSL